MPESLPVRIDDEPRWCLIALPDSRFHGMYVYASNNDMPQILEGKRDPMLAMTGQEALAFLKFTVNTWVQQYEGAAMTKMAEPPDEAFGR